MKEDYEWLEKEIEKVGEKLEKRVSENLERSRRKRFWKVERMSQLEEYVESQEGGSVATALRSILSLLG